MDISIGMVCKAERRAEAVTTGLAPEVARVIAGAPALNVDETGWSQSRRRAWLWTEVGWWMTLFRIDRPHGAKADRCQGRRKVAC